MRVEEGVLRARLRAPWVSSRASLEEVELLLVRVLDTDGLAGHGEASAIGAPDGKREAALELARWDLHGRRERRPLFELLGGQAAPPVEVNATIARADRAGAAQEAAAARLAGLRCVKVKVGIGDDSGRLAAVRAAAGPEMAIRIDANGAWTASEAIASLRALEPIGIELCEEPTSGVDEIERVSSLTNVPIAIDESTLLPGALDHRCCTAACLKIARGGGIGPVLDAASRAKRAGYEVYLASSLDGPLGIAAALHAAAVIKPDRPCGLATLGFFADREDPMPIHDGRIAVPRGFGLGDGLVDWYDAF
ncbi:MAG: mandelate racemase/muconate lactonizing enzyme family protein [Solirubrobacterales bacterium]|nr:mandelate racemase/muconate lactonizing enzyme family protein [Solirubrobacterales bacterium]